MIKTMMAITNKMAITPYLSQAVRNKYGIK